jgi:hypothetical protein
MRGALTVFTLDPTDGTAVALQWRTVQLGLQVSASI